MISESTPRTAGEKVKCGVLVLGGLCSWRERSGEGARGQLRQVCEAQSRTSCVLREVKDPGKVVGRTQRGPWSDLHCEKCVWLLCGEQTVGTKVEAGTSEVAVVKDSSCSD